MKTERIRNTTKNLESPASTPYSGNKDPPTVENDPTEEISP